MTYRRIIVPDQIQYNAYQIQEKLAALEEALNSNIPNIASLLRDIHTQLKKDTDLVTLLTEEECSILVRGLKKQTATEIATAALKGSRKKPLSKTTINDL